MPDTDNFDDRHIIAFTAWGEFRSGGREGMATIINVIENRVKHPTWWGHDWRSVCLDPWQFSCWNKNDPNRPKLLTVLDTDKSMCVALQLADLAIQGKLQDVTAGADSYFDEMSNWPDWCDKLTPCFVLWPHRYYKMA